MYRNSDDFSPGMLQWRIDVPVHRAAREQIKLAPPVARRIQRSNCTRTPLVVSRSGRTGMGPISQTRFSERETASGVRELESVMSRFFSRQKIRLTLHLERLEERDQP